MKLERFFHAIVLSVDGEKTSCENANRTETSRGLRIQKIYGYKIRN
jgi:hypothetical protein